MNTFAEKRVTEQAAIRRETFNQRRNAYAELRARIRVAVAAGVPDAQLVATATMGRARFGWRAVGALSRQRVYEIINETRAHPDAMRTTYTTHGSPSPEDAEAAIADAITDTIAAVDAYSAAMSELARRMWDARDRGVPATTVATWSGLASKAAYEYLAAQHEWNRVNTALAGLLGTDDKHPDRLAPVMLKVRQLQIAILVNGTPDHQGRDNPGPTIGTVSRLLAPLGYEPLPDDAGDYWTVLRRRPDQSAEPA